MKIGILTVPFNNNYGGYLQAYALKYLLIQQGHSVVFINRRRDINYNIKDFFKRITGFSLYRVYKIKKISRNTNTFRDKYLSPITKSLFSSEEIKECINNMGLDCLIVGSDQVWRYKYAQNSITDYFFGFIENENIPRFSYAASMGTSEMEYPVSMRIKCSKLLEQFTSISVREKNTINLLKKDFNIQGVEHVLDPTLLLKPEVYFSLFNNMYKVPTCPYLVTYMLEENKDQRANIMLLAEKMSLRILNIKAQTGSIWHMKILEPVEKWLFLIANASFVITDSFHGTVFSILFNRPFLTYYNNTRGVERLHDLLGEFQLESKMVPEGHYLTDMDLSDYNWSKVNSILNKRRNESIAFLNNSLAKCLC